MSRKRKAMNETPDEGRRCAYELCKRSDPITVIAGHRPRRYHDENCRQAQHRLQKHRAQGPTNECDQTQHLTLAELEEERAKYAALLADYMQAAKKIGKLERDVQRFQRMKVLQTRESMLQELMVLGGRLTYASLTDLGIEEGIEHWLNYIRGACDEDLAMAIAHGYWQADHVAMAASEVSDAKMGMQMRKRINELERDVALRDARIAELAQGQGLEEAGDVLHRQQRERQAQRIAELEDQVKQEITEIHKLQGSHSSTMYQMNILLAQAQTAQREGATAGPRIAELERKVEKQQQRIGKQQVQYASRVSDLEHRLKELEAERAEWIAWKEAETRGHGDLTAMRQYFQEYPEAMIPVKRNGVTLRIWALGEDAVAFSEDHGIIRLSDEELQQGRVWVCKKTGVPVIATWLPIGESR